MPRSTPRSMPPLDESSRLQCPIGLFDVCDSRLRELTLAVNEAEGEEKVQFAKDLIKENERLLACKEFDEGDENCVLCRNFARLRHKTASLVVQMMTPGSQKGRGA